MKTLIKKISTPTAQKNWFSEVLIFIPRFVAGLLLSIDFGSSKFGMPWSPSENELQLLEVASWFPEDVANFGAPFSWAPWFFAWMAAASEAIGGILLALGLQTRISSFLITCTMLVAIFFQKWDSGTWSMLPAMGFLWLAMYNMVIGGGRISLDYALTKIRIPRMGKLSVAAIALFVGLTSMGMIDDGGTATVYIDPQEEFVLGEYQKTGFKVKLKNLGPQIVEIKVVNKSTKEQVQGFGLDSNGEATVYVDKGDMVLLQNNSDKEAKVKAKLSRGVEGMRYQQVNTYDKSE